MKSRRQRMTTMGGPVKKAGTFRGKSNRLGYGGRAAQLKAKGVPGGVIGRLARKAGAAPGGPNYHGKRARKISRKRPKKGFRSGERTLAS